MERLSLALVEFRADEPERALRFWGVCSALPWSAAAKERVKAGSLGPPSRRLGSTRAVVVRGSFSLPYFAVGDLLRALGEVEALGGSVVHPGDSWAICKDSEGGPFGLAASERGWT
jgi:predicted enzyme related to lactoylglutathione lyase